MDWFDEFVTNVPAGGGGGGGGGDTTPPAQTVISPSAGSTLGVDYPSAAQVPVVVSIVDASSAIAFVEVSVRYSDRAYDELVYSGTGGASGFTSAHRAYSTITGSGAAGVGFQLSIRRDAGWPQSANGLPIAAVFTYKAVDASGNVLT